MRCSGVVLPAGIKRFRTYFWRSVCVVGALVLAACGGGGDDGGGTSGPGTSGGTAGQRSGLLTYSLINTVYGVEMASNETRRILDADLDLSLVAVMPGPDGELAVAYNSSTTGPDSTLTILRADGSTERVNSFPFTIEGRPKFSADGSKIVFAAGSYSGGNQSRFVQVVERDGTPLYYFDDFDSPEWLPDDRLVIRDRQDSNFYLTNEDPFQALAAIPNTQGAVKPTINPDGSKLAFNGPTSDVSGSPRHIYMMNLDGTDRRQVTTSSEGLEVDVLFSPDGKELVVTTSGCVTVSSTGMGAGDVDNDLIHIIPADSQMIEISRDRSSAPTRLLDAGGTARCTSGAVGWR